MITLAKLAKRDKWICHICTKRVNSLADATREHVVPKHLGGTAGINSSNIKLAHRWCNEAKGKKLFRVEQHKNGWVIVDPNDVIGDIIYTTSFEPQEIVDSLNRDKIYLEKKYA